MQDITPLSCQQDENTRCLCQPRLWMACGKFEDDSTEGMNLSTWKGLYSDWNNNNWNYQ